MFFRNYTAEMPDELESVIARVKTGDEDALAELFHHYKGQLRRIISFRMDQNLKGRIDPSDVLQEAYIDLAKRLPEFGKQDGMSFFVWLRLVTKERLLGFHRQHLATQKRDARREVRIRQNTSGASSVFLAAHLLGRQTSVVGKAIRAEQRAQLEAILDTMDETDREIIALRVFEGLTNGEAAEVLGLTRQTTSKRFIRAIGRLRETLGTIPGFHST